MPITLSCGPLWVSDTSWPVFSFACNDLTFTAGDHAWRRLKIRLEFGNSANFCLFLKSTETGPLNIHVTLSTNFPQWRNGAHWTWTSTRQSVTCSGNQGYMHTVLSLHFIGAVSPAGRYPMSAQHGYSVLAHWGHGWRLQEASRESVSKCFFSQ